MGGLNNKDLLVLVEVVASEEEFSIIAEHGLWILYDPRSLVNLVSYNEFFEGQDNLGLRAPDVYRIPCECGMLYVHQADRSVDTMLKDHQRNIRLGHPNNSTVAEQCYPGTQAYSFTLPQSSSQKPET
jgi:hypothetical protein